MSDVLSAGGGHPWGLRPSIIGDVDPVSSPAALDRVGVHTLSNHLAVILGFIELVISETKPDDPRRPDLFEIRDAAIEAARLLGHASRLDES